MTNDKSDKSDMQWGESREVPAQEVGYKKPPVHGQVRPGEVRNPYGRRGKRGRHGDTGGGLALEIMRELDMVIPVKVGGKTKKLPVSQIIARRVREDLMGSAKDRHQALATLHKFRMFDGLADFQNWREHEDRLYDECLDEAIAEAELIQKEYHEKKCRNQAAAASAPGDLTVPDPSEVDAERSGEDMRQSGDDYYDGMIGR